MITPPVISNKQDQSQSTSGERSQSTSGDEVTKVISFKTTADDRPSRSRRRPKVSVRVPEDIRVPQMTECLPPPTKKKNISRHFGFNKPKHDKKVTSGPLDNFLKSGKISGSSQESSLADNVSEYTHSNDLAEPKHPRSVR